MTEQVNDNVILFPKTIEYYQYELTRMLEAERYGEAVRLLRFLLNCRHHDHRVQGEWQSLLDWLQMMFPEEQFPLEDEQEELTEEELLREQLRLRGREGEEYAEKLLAALEQPYEVDKQLLALEQLALVEHPRVNDVLEEWATRPNLHPMLQFKALQTLQRRGATGSVTLYKLNEETVVDLEDTPPTFDDFPAQIHEIMLRVQEISETQHPALSYFAQETWNEFLAFIYGTSQYRQMLRQDSSCIDVWAAALHLTLLEHVFHSGDREELLDLYGITSHLLFQWEQAYRVMKQFAATMFSGRM
ncbi:hypothetical protein [Paenibacillus silviterrae]|uniref:hypothetical protein n=1 Tax=Paenibacillus silviterrae TaxID=3242194 RepID=UPI002542C99C|nr:hypothetical protein [Paenibacillus chinjuensis]